MISVIQIDAINHGYSSVSSLATTYTSMHTWNPTGFHNFEDTLSKLTPEGAMAGNTKWIICKMAAMVTGVTITLEHA